MGNIFKPTIMNESLHEISNDNEVRVINFSTSTALSEVQCSHITTFINTLGLLVMGRHNHIHHILIAKSQHE
jgi:hypothetical protein